MIRRVQVVKELRMTVPRRHLLGGILGKTIIPVESILWQVGSALTTPVGSVRIAPPGVPGSRPFPQATEEEGEENAGNPIGSKKALVQTNVTIANTLMTPVGSVRVAPPGVSGSQPFPQATEEEREENAGNPIGSKKVLVQTDVTAQVTAALTAAMQRKQQDHAASMAKLATQLTDQLRDHQMWWAYMAKDQAAAHALVRTQLMELAEVQPEEAMENVQVKVTQVLKQTKPEVPLGSPAKEVQPEAQLEPTAKENIPAATADMAALIATLQTMQHDMQLSPGGVGFPILPAGHRGGERERQRRRSHRR
jgi:hypothetical protein